MNFKKLISIFTITLLPLQTFAKDSFSYTQWGDINQFTATAFAITYSLSDGNKEGVYDILKSYASTIASTHLLKRAINAQRPNGGDYSFPSGHSASAMSGVGYLYMNYGWKVATPFFLIALSVGHSRVEGDYHYPIDVLAGFSLALGFDYYFNKDKTHQVSLIHPEKETWGLRVSLSY